MVDPKLEPPLPRGRLSCEMATQPAGAPFLPAGHGACAPTEQRGSSPYAGRGSREEEEPDVELEGPLPSLGGALKCPRPPCLQSLHSEVKMIGPSSRVCCGDETSGKGHEKGMETRATPALQGLEPEYRGRLTCMCLNPGELNTNGLLDEIPRSLLL